MCIWITLCHFFAHASQLVNPLDCKSSYSATSNNMKLVHQLAIDEWAVTFDTARPGPSLLYHMLQPAHRQSVYQSLYCCIMVRWSAVLMCPLKG